MVIAKRLLTLFIATAIAIPTSAMAAQRQTRSGPPQFMSLPLPTAEAIKTTVDDIKADLAAFRDSPSDAKLRELQESVNVFKGQIAVAAQAVDAQRGGAATSRALAAFEMVTEAASEISDAMFEVRETKQDAIKASGLQQKYEDVWLNELLFPLVNSAFKLGRVRVDERSGVDGRVSPADMFIRTIRQLGTFVFALGTPIRNRTTGEWDWRLRSNLRREDAVQNLIPLFQQFADTRIDELNARYDGDLEYERENFEERFAGQLLFLSDRMVNIKVEQFSALLYTRIATDIAGAAYFLFGPNFMGDSYYATLETLILTVGITAGMHLLQFMTTSVRTTAEWIDFNRSVRSELKEGMVKSTELYLSQVNPTEYHPAYVPKWIEKKKIARETLDGLIAAAKDRCRALVSGGKRLSKPGPG